MAKPKDISTSPWESYASAGARIVRVRADELCEHADGVLDTGDIERVHDMRVASRRLRAVLEIFAPCFPRAEYESVLRDVKRLADALGERRDPDVHVAAMEAFAAAQPPALRPGIARLTEHQRERQARGNALLAAELERGRERDLHGRLVALSEAAMPRSGQEPGDDGATADGPSADGGSPDGATVGGADGAGRLAADGAGP